MTDPAHSEQFFGDTRDFWWNRDFLELMARRWKLAEVSKVLDVGCGRGHWSQALAPVLPATCEVIGVDPEPKSIEFANGRAVERQIGDRFLYKVGAAEKLMFPDGAFDFVTCQTVLIHLKNPKAALSEMLRVLRPGGLLAVVEPNNQANAMARDSLGLELEAHLEIVRFQGRCERGKKKLGLGFNSMGDQVPGLFSDLGLSDIQVFVSDKASPLLPPYASPEQHALKCEMVDWAERGLYLWDKAETWRYFEADGGTPTEFEACWSKTGQVKLAIRDQLTKGTYQFAGGAMVYLVSGRKPLKSGA